MTINLKKNYLEIIKKVASPYQGRCNSNNHCISGSCLTWKTCCNHKINFIHSKINKIKFNLAKGTTGSKCYTDDDCLNGNCNRGTCSKYYYYEI